jgi:gas vesicle protein GvpA/GvpJ/GvpM family
MAKRDVTIVDQVMEPREQTLLDVVDELLNKGVVADGDVTLGVAGIDLIYLRLSALLCAADCVLPKDPAAPVRKSRHREPGRRKLLR